MSGQLECSYCDEEFDSQEELSDHTAQHFRDTEKIPVTTKNRNKDSNVVKDWSNDVEELYKIPGIRKDMDREQIANTLEDKIQQLEGDIHG